MIDSVYTAHIVNAGIAKEGNPLIVWTMNAFNWSIDVAMIARIIFCIPFLYILDKWDWSRFTVVCYLCLYVLLTGLQGII